LPAHWDALPGWADADMRPALGAFLRSCARLDHRSDSEALSPRAQWAGRVGDWRAACTAAAMTGPDAAAAQATFEAFFAPVRAIALDEAGGAIAETGLLTGYYEPYVEVRAAADAEFSQALRRRPDDLVSVDLGLFESDLAGRRLVGRVNDGSLVRYYNRAEIEVDNRGEIFAWGRPIDVFFLQIQGSGRLVNAEGNQSRAAFSAHNGLPYRSIGRELIERGELEAHAASKAGIEAWLNRNGSDATAELFSVNPRYVFFETQALDDPGLGPRGSSGVALTPMASIAVDPAYHAWGVPVWLAADLPDLPAWTGLVVTQDGGGAINGPLRGDFFWGWGEVEERRAGTTRAQAQWTVLLPISVAQRIVDATPPA
tara:strand:+ start:1283 stop:2395 length:1113 start_codon:yes stop_codon:yes gene_type:complete